MTSDTSTMLTGEGACPCVQPPLQRLILHRAKASSPAWSACPAFPPARLAPARPLDQEGRSPPLRTFAFTVPAACIACIALPPHIWAAAPSPLLGCTSNATFSEKSSLAGYLKLQPLAFYPLSLFYVFLLLTW